MQFPRQLADTVPLLPRSPGAYDVQWGTDLIRILVMSEMPEAEQNRVWNLFSGKREHIASAFKRIQPRLHSYSSLVNKLLDYYGLEGMAMPYTMEDFERDVAEDLLKRLTSEQRLKGLTAEQILSTVSLEEIENDIKEKKAQQEKNNSDPPKPQS